MAYIYPIAPNSGDEHQVSPAYVLTFVRWENRDTVNFPDSDPLVRKPLVVISDAVSISIQDSKSGVTPAVTIVLKGGDINYATAVAAGDFFTVNLVNSEEKALDIYGRASSQQAINRFDDGFKGLFKVQKVRRKISQDPNSGTRTVTYIVHGFGFTEFNSVMYYDPIASTQFNDELFLTQFQGFFSGIVSSYQNESNIQQLLLILCQVLIGCGLNQAEYYIRASQNTQFLIPADVGKLINIRTAKYAIDIYKVYLGIWGASQSGTSAAQGFNPSVELYPANFSFYKVGNQVLKGYRVLGAENWNMVQIFSIISSWANTTVNELYTASARVGIDGYVYPALIIRQKPFSSPNLNSKIEGTKFLDLPRWSISPKLVYDFDVGKDEVGRINFVQVYTQSVSANQSEDQAAQVGLGNYFYDKKDIERHGLRPFSTTANFDYPENKGGRRAREWAELLFDMMNAGQNRESGTISTQGIVEPICVGDNLQFDGNVYHIEQVTHTWSIDQLGRKSFKTNMTLSYGTPADSQKGKVKYSQMDFTDSSSEKTRDQRTEDIMPAFSDTQSLPNNPNRTPDGEEIKKTPEKSFNRATLENANRGAGQAKQVIPPPKEEKK